MTLKEGSTKEVRQDSCIRRGMLKRDSHAQIVLRDAVQAVSRGNNRVYGLQMAAWGLEP